MLIYKKILLNPAGREGSEQTRYDNDKRIKDLQREIKQLTDGNSGNDKIDSGILDTNNALSKGFVDALKKTDRKTVSNLLKSLEKAQIKIGTDGNVDQRVRTSVNHLMDAIKKIQSKRVFDDFDKMMTSDGLKLLNSFSDDEINNLVGGISNDSITKESALKLYKKMVAAKDNAKDFRHTDREYYTKIKAAIENKYFNNSADTSTNIDTANNELSDIELNNLFNDITTEKLKRFAQQYANIENWDGSNLEDNKQIMIPEGMLFSAKNFITKFNEANKKRLTDADGKVKVKIEGLNISNLKLADNKIVVVNENGSQSEFDYKTLVNEDNAIIPELVDADEINRGHFSEIKRGREDALKQMISQAEQVTTGDFEDGSNLMGTHTVDNVGKINKVVSSNIQFLKIEKEGGKNVLKFNVNKAKEYIKGIIKLYDNKDVQNEWSKNITGDNRLAWFSAAQILLNDKNKDDNSTKLNIDGILGDKTRAATKKFQEEYNKSKGLTENSEGYIKTDAVPGPLTLAALLDVNINNVPTTTPRTKTNTPATQGTDNEPGTRQGATKKQGGATNTPSAENGASPDTNTGQNNPTNNPPTNKPKATVEKLDPEGVTKYGLRWSDKYNSRSEKGNLNIPENKPVYYMAEKDGNGKIKKDNRGKERINKDYVYYKDGKDFVRISVKEPYKKQKCSTNGVSNSFNTAKPTLNVCEAGSRELNKLIDRGIFGNDVTVTKNNGSYFVNGYGISRKLVDEFVDPKSTFFGSSDNKLNVVALGLRAAKKLIDQRGVPFGLLLTPIVSLSGDIITSEIGYNVIAESAHLRKFNITNKQAFANFVNTIKQSSK